MPLKTIDRTGRPGVEMALVDLQRDAAAVLPLSRPKASRLPTVEVLLSLDCDRPAETFVLEISPALIRLTASDELGAIYGIYEISHRLLGVEPLWFWCDIAPPKLSIEEFVSRLTPQMITSLEPKFRYRGWFVNDEDLLATWRPSGQQRFRDWPGRAATAGRSTQDEGVEYEARLLRYYTSIAASETMEMVYEALLRLRGNLIIPASFIDIMNEPEAAIIRAAVRRGLYVSQHHVEPLGVSHFAFETWTAKRMSGAPLPAFSYLTAPDDLRACWTVYAQEWVKLTGDRVIWQVGLRGRGDRSLWSHEPEAEARAGELIAAALADQMEIVRSVDSRSVPPSTLTLWSEGARLILRGNLVIPRGVACIFADKSQTQEFQEDFRTFSREGSAALKRKFGIYYHVAVWGIGPHLVQGPKPSKIARIIDEVVRRGDTHYAILNVSNLREHVMGAQCFMEQIGAPEPGITDSGWLKKWSPPGLALLHVDLLSLIPEIAPGFHLHDGATRCYLYNEIRTLETGAKPQRGVFEQVESRRQLGAAVAGLTAFCERISQPDFMESIEPRFHSFFRTNLLAQSKILLGLYRALEALLAHPQDVETALRGLDCSLSGCLDGERPARWKGWYAGDTKMGLAGLRDRLRIYSQGSAPT